jgi:hypothetical protein
MRFPMFVPGAALRHKTIVTSAGGGLQTPYQRRYMNTGCPMRGIPGSRPVPPRHGPAKSGKCVSIMIGENRVFRWLGNHMTPKPCKFTFDDTPAFDGFDLGSTWNGFDNLPVNPARSA